MLHFDDIFTVWNAYGKDCVLDFARTQNGKEYCSVTVTSATKNKVTNKYENDWKGKIKFFGNAFEKIKGLGLVDRDKVKIKGMIQNMGTDGKFLQYANIVGWDVEKIISDKKPIPTEPVVTNEIEPLDINVDQLPF